MIRFEHIVKRFGDKTVLDDVSLAIADKQVQFIIGMSGTGKSVLMKHLVGLLKPDAGRVLLDGEDISGYDERQFYAVRKKCGMVFQHSTLFDSLTLLENIAMPLRKHFRLARAEAESQAQHALELVHLATEARRYPADFGAGVCKRAAIARAIALKPRYLIYDEPTTALDPVAARRIDALIREMADVTGVTSLVVSHDLTSIFTIADRVAFLYGGKLRFDGTPAELKASDDGVVQQFIAGRDEGPIQ